MTTNTANKFCPQCNKSQNEWDRDGEGITIGAHSYCSDTCAKASQVITLDPSNPITKIEKEDAYNANDGESPFDEAPVEAGGSRI